MGKLESKYTYEIHMERVRDHINQLRELHHAIKESFIELELKMQRVNTLMDELDVSEITLEITPIKKEPKVTWINQLKNKIKQLRKH
mgnify:CR=1 FL=1